MRGGCDSRFFEKKLGKKLPLKKVETLAERVIKPLGFKTKSICYRVASNFINNKKAKDFSFAFLL